MRHLAWSVIAVISLMVCGSVVDGAVIKTDPNTPQARATGANGSDTRLAQKISYECKSKPTREILDELSQMTGVAFISGKNRLDWQIRDAKMTMFVKDVPLAELMNSMARVMRFKWSRNGEGPKWSYRLVDDEEAVRKAADKLNGIEQAMVQARIKTLKRLRETANLSDEELNALKTSSPYLYMMGKTGFAKAYTNLAKQVPELEKAIINQTELFIPPGRLSTGATQAMREMAGANWKLMLRNEPFPKEYEERFHKMGIIVREALPLDNQAMYATGSLGQFCIGENKNSPDFWLGLNDADNRISNTEYKYCVKSMEEGHDTWRSVTPEDKKILHSWETECFLEPLLERRNLPELNRKVTVKTKEIRNNVCEQVAAKANVCLVSDSYKIDQLRRLSISLQDSEIYKVLDAVTLRGQPYSEFDWDKPAGIVEISNRNWYQVRQLEIPDAWIERWKKTVEETGTLDLDELAEMAALTDTQYWVNVGNDKALKNGMLGRQMERNRDYLKVYSTLSKSQRSALLSKAGLSLSALNTAQQESVFKLISGVDLPEGMPDLQTTGLDIRATASRAQEGKKFVYTFGGSINGIPIPGEYVLSTPEYKTGEKEQK